MSVDIGEETGYLQPHIEKGPAGMVVVKDDFDKGFDSTIWSAKRINPERYSYTQIAGKNALRIELRRGDKQATNLQGIVTERSEISEAEGRLLPLGTDAWYGFSFYFSEDFPILDNRTVFAQWKQFTKGEESPFISFRYVGGDLICKVADPESENRVKFLKRGEWRGNWHRLLLNYQLGANQQGFAHAWLDGEEFANYQGKMGHESTRDLTYFKMGLYRDQVDPMQIVYFAAYRRGFDRQDCL